MRPIKSLYQSLSPIFYFSKFFALAPFNLRTNNEVFKTSFYDYLVFIISEILYSSILWITIIANINKSGLSESNIFNICIVAALIMNNVVIIISLLMSMIVRQKLFQALKLINDCDEMV